MPFYDLKCNDCGEEFTVMCRYAEKSNQSCPECGSTQYENHYTTAPGIGDPVRLGVRTVDNGFREVLSKISKAPGSNLKNKLSRS